ncbi:Pollen Ole e 1 allergen and extensin family protein [Hirschfeldia incana]|nr:Pollen Ole e 1 allergen and extensin family protein [Hirschfeldia incana]
MANQTAIAVCFLFVLAVFSNFELSASTLVLGKVSCLDCHSDFDFSGVKVLLMCDGEKKPTITMAASDGSFRSVLPTADKKRSTNCLAKILGGPEQIYAHKHNMVSELVKSKHDTKVLTTSNPLSFSLSCPKPTGDNVGRMIGDSKTVNFPGAGGFGFPPASFFPFLPIIGIP